MARARWFGGWAVLAVTLGVPACGDDLPAADEADASVPDLESDVDLGEVTDPGDAAPAQQSLPDGSDGSAASDGGGAADGALPARLPVEIPSSSAGWTFAGPQQGGPNRVLGASLDEGGNLWVAGGEEGLFVLRAGAASFQRYTIADGLRPYGWMADGSDPPGARYLKVISVSGAWAGAAFVGYEGKPPGAGALGCEDNWDGPSPDPSIYKSGDADRVTLSGGGISVVHYDIFSGPGIVGGELRGREKICDVLRIRYDAANRKVWFAGNHGFAMGDANHPGNGRCNWADSPSPPVPTVKSDPFNNDYGHAGCNGVSEHTHPAINGLSRAGTCCSYLTGGYYGVALDPGTHDVWFAGQIRTTRFHYATTGGNYYAAQSMSEDPPYAANRIDIWPDAVQEPAIPSVADRKDDLASGAAVGAGGTVWVSSFQHGLARLDAAGSVVGRLTAAEGLASDRLSAVIVDPADQSVWVGTSYGPGVSRLSSGAITFYGPSVFGFDLANEGTSDVQVAGSGRGRKIVVAFRGDDRHAGAVGIYTGP